MNPNDVDIFPIEFYKKAGDDFLEQLRSDPEVPKTKIEQQKKIVAIIKENPEIKSTKEVFSFFK